MKNPYFGIYTRKDKWGWDFHAHNHISPEPSNCRTLPSTGFTSMWPRLLDNTGKYMPRRIADLLLSNWDCLNCFRWWYMVKKSLSPRYDLLSTNCMVILEIQLSYIGSTDFPSSSFIFTKTSWYIWSISRKVKCRFHFSFFLWFLFLYCLHFLVVFSYFRQEIVCIVFQVVIYGEIKAEPSEHLLALSMGFSSGWDSISLLSLLFSKYRYSIVQDMFWSTNTMVILEIQLSYIGSTDFPSSSFIFTKTSWYIWSISRKVKCRFHFSYFFVVFIFILFAFFGSF